MEFKGAKFIKLIEVVPGIYPADDAKNGVIAAAAVTQTSSIAILRSIDP